MSHGSHYFDQDMSGAEVRPFLAGEVAVFSKRCPGKDSACEDSAGLIPYGANSGLLVVADGLGGQPAGDQASRLAVMHLEESLARGWRAGMELRDAILNGFEEANQTISRMAVGAATTMAVVEIQGRTVRPYHAGDSMILAVGQRGRLKLQTVSHSPVGYAVEAGFLDQEEALHHAERHLVLNMLGSAGMHISIGPPMTLADHDTLLVASDGLCDNLHVREIVERIRKGPLHGAADQLRDDSLRRMADSVRGQPSKPDDLTFILYRPMPARQRASRTRLLTTASC
jgi:serine/threonine protein phosphatase PrpC